MPEEIALRTALGGHGQVPPDWMPASQVQPFISNDPAIVWLEYHGAQDGFEPDSTPYAFGDFIAEKGREFEQAWLREVAPGAPRVCADARDIRTPRKVHETWALMQQGAPLIAQPALWWAPERVYGAPDLLVHTSWIRQRFPDLLDDAEAQARRGRLDGHYVVFDQKFTTKLDDRRKTRDLEVYAAQVRIYTYMLGQLQGTMPKQAFLVARDRLFDPLPVDIGCKLGGPLDEDLAAMRDQFVEIKVNGDQYAPWQDEIVASNPDEASERWHTAKRIIAVEKTPGGDSSLLYRIGPAAKAALAAQGYASLEDLLRADPDDVPLEQIKGLGAKRAAQIRAVLRANRSGAPVLPPPEVLPVRMPFEFYVDYEYFTNVNVDFEAQWPALEGCEMVFMIGVGWWDGANWRFKAIVAGQESQYQELKAFHEFIDFLLQETGGKIFDRDATALYHWSSAEVWQTRRVADRHGLPKDHPQRYLPWVDLQKVFLNGPAALPGAWKFGLKAVASALGALEPVFETRWPGDLDAGLQAMVMGWRAYEEAEPWRSREMGHLREYLGADCQALWQILRWLRAVAQ